MPSINDSMIGGQPSVIAGGGLKSGGFFFPQNSNQTIQDFKRKSPDCMLFQGKRTVTAG